MALPRLKSIFHVFGTINNDRNPYLGGFKSSHLKPVFLGKHLH